MLLWLERALEGLMLSATTSKCVGRGRSIVWALQRLIVPRCTVFHARSSKRIDRDCTRDQISFDITLGPGLLCLLSRPPAVVQPTDASDLRERIANRAAGMLHRSVPSAVTFQFQLL